MALVRHIPATTRGFSPGRVVIVPVENMEVAQAYYNSPDYQEAKSFREGAAEAQFFLVEGPE